jgi:predicted short-subunit dehydrogenase-like oxidoreductase (DUF2520 family)
MSSVHGAIGIVGAGAVAQTLGRALAAHGAKIVALASRDMTHAAAAAGFIGGQIRVVDTATLATVSSHIVIATADTAIRSVAESVASVMTRGVVVHTCGGCGLADLASLREKGIACGVWHPLQTFPAPEVRPESLAGNYYAVSGDPDAVQWAQQTTRLIAGQPITIDPETLSLYHAGAALASNGIVAIVDGALAMLVAAGVDRREALAAIAPLCRRSLDNVLAVEPEAALTGPVARGDARTVRNHLAALKDRGQLQLPLYREIARALIGIARRRGASETSLRQLLRALE